MLGLLLGRKRVQDNAAGSAAVGMRRLAIRIEDDRRNDPNRSSRGGIPDRHFDDLRREVAQVVAKHMLLDSDDKVTVREQRQGSVLYFTIEFPEGKDDPSVSTDKPRKHGQTRKYGLLDQARQ